jgi:putative endonuclease
VRRGRKLVFCEVKAKAGAERGDPLEMVSPEKVRRLRRAAEAWLAVERGLDGCEARFDVAAERNGRLNVIANAF